MFSFAILILIVAFIGLVLLGISILYLRWNFEYWTRRNVCGPKPKLLCGTFPKTSEGKCNLVEELHEIYLKYKNTEKFVGIYTARSPKLFILDPKLATQILTQHFKSFRDNESSQWTSPSVEQMRVCSPFVSTGDAWKERRSELAPVLTASRLRASHSAMLDSAKQLIEFIEPYSGMPMDAKELANRFTTQLMANFIWGIEGEAFKGNEFSIIHQMGNSMMSQTQACLQYYGRTAAWPWLRKFKRVRFFPITFDRFFKQLAADAMEMRAKAPQERYDVINHLLQLKDKKSLNDIQIAGHTTTVLIDGFETAAVLIAHCLMLISRNPRVQQKLRDELMTAGENTSYDVLNELPYLDQVLQETLRIFPPLTTLFKLSTESITLENFNGSQLNLPPNVGVYISSYSFQRDGDYYANPEEIWPERFDAEFGGVRKYREMGVFLPFGDGPRICPGMKLGLAEAKIAVSEIVRSYQLKCSTKMRTDNKISASSLLLTVDGGIELIFVKL